jgi:hypothetical protein
MKLAKGQPLDDCPSPKKGQISHKIPSIFLIQFLDIYLSINLVDFLICTEL